MHRLDTTQQDLTAETDARVGKDINLESRINALEVSSTGGTGPAGPAGADGRDGTDGVDGVDVRSLVTHY